MVRGKVKLAFIQKDTARKSTFKNRQCSLIKMVSELITLIGTEGCCIVYALNEVDPVVWPSVEEARDFLLRFRALPEIEQRRKMVNHDKFLQDMVSKLRQQKQKREKEVNNLEMTVLMYEIIDGRRLEHVGMQDATTLRFLLNEKVKEFNKAKKKAVEDEQKREGEKHRQVQEMIAEMSSELNWMSEMVPDAQSSLVQPLVDPGTPWIDGDIFNHDE